MLQYAAQYGFIIYIIAFNHSLLLVKYKIKSFAYSLTLNWILALVVP